MFQTKFVALEKSSSEADKGEKKSKSLKQQVTVCVVSGMIKYNHPTTPVRTCAINEISSYWEIMNVIVNCIIAKLQIHKVIIIMLL